MQQNFGVNAVVLRQPFYLPKKLATCILCLADLNKIWYSLSKNCSLFSDLVLQTLPETWKNAAAEFFLLFWLIKLPSLKVTTNYTLRLTRKTVWVLILST